MHRIPDSPVYGVYSEWESDVTSAYTVTAGMKVSRKGSPGKDLTEVHMSGGEYLLFEGHGLMPQIVIETWKQIWEFFSANKEYAQVRNRL